MNIKTTIVLCVLILIGGAAWLGVTMLAPSGAASETLTTLETKLQPDAISRIEITRGERKVVLEKGADGWSLPGKWPVRKPEVDHLVSVLSSLRSRFTAVSAASEDDLEKLGLAGSQVLHVTVKANGQDYKLTFGEEKGESSRFSRPTFLRLGDSPEALRVAPGLIATLDRPQKDYMQRRLFPVERVAKDGGERTEHVEQLAANSVAARGPGESYQVVRADDGWELREPVRDRVDPDKIKTILSSVPDIWVEKFVEPEKKGLEEYGLKEPEQVLTVTLPKGDTITLLIGKTSEKRSRIVQKPGPAQFMPKPQIDVVEEEFKYAKLQENDQVFEIKADKLKDVVVAANTLRDPRLARFKTEDVKKVSIHEGGRALDFAREDAGWKLLVKDKTAFDVERSRIDDLLDKLSGLRADGKDIRDKADPKTDGLDKPATVKVTAEAGKDKEKKTREYTFLLGKQEGGEKGKVFVQVAGWDRVNAVEGELLKLAQRPALAYRNRHVVNFSMFDAARVDVDRSGEKYALEHADNKWRLAAPVQADLDQAKADSLPRDLAQLEAVEFITADPKAEDLDKVYGLAKPAATVKVAFTDKKKAEQVVELGKKRDGKEEYYARIRGDNAVFTVKKDVYETLTRDSLSLRSAELWKLAPDEIAEVRIRRGEEYDLKREGEAWKLSGPFSAPVAADQLKALTEELAHPKADKFVAHAATDLAMYGLDNPYLRVTVKPGAKKEKEKEPEKTKDKDTKERVLLVGKPVDKDGKARYARLGDTEAIFVLGEKAVAAVDHGALDLLDRKLLAVSPNTIKSIRTTTDKETFTLNRDRDGWKVERSDGPAFTPDAESADDAVLLWARLTAQKLVAYGNKVDLAKFGLEKPGTTVTIVTAEKGNKDKAEKTIEHKLLLGDEVKDTKGTRYARIEGQPAVAVLDASVVTELQRTPLDFVNRSLLKLDASKASGLTRKLGNDTLEVVKKDDHWRIVKPSEHAADDTILRSLTGELARLRAKKVAAYPAKNVKAFGLDAPAAMVALHVEDGKEKSNVHTLEIGKVVDEKGGGDRYARLEKSETVVVIPARLVEQLMAPPLQFRDRLLAKIPAVGKVVVERGVRKATFASKDGEWKMTQPLEAEAERGDLEDLVKAFAELRADKLVAEKAGDLKPYGLDRPQLTLQLFAPEGAKESLTLLVGGKEKDSPRVYAKVAGSDMIALLDDKLSALVLAEHRKRTVWSQPLDSFQVEKLTFGYEKNGFTLEKKGSDWQVVGKADKVKAETVRETLDVLARLKVERWVIDKDADLKEFGLDPPFLSLEIDTGTGKRTLKLGRQEGGSGRYYATVVGENSGAVFLLGERDGQAIARPLQAFLGGKS
jgi:hypothetical protein